MNAPTRRARAILVWQVGVFLSLFLSSYFFIASLQDPEWLYAVLSDKVYPGWGDVKEVLLDEFHQHTVFFLAGLLATLVLFLVLYVRRNLVAKLLGRYWVTASLISAVLLCGAAVQIESLGKTRFERLSVLERQRQEKDCNPARSTICKILLSADVPWLEQIARDPYGAEQWKLADDWSGGLDLARAAYARLGALATKESLAAVRRIEQAARNLRSLKAASPFGAQLSVAHDSGIPSPLAKVRAPDGTEYAVVVSNSLLGDLDVFITSSTTPEDKASWTRPKLIPNRIWRSIRNPKLAWKSPNTLSFTFTQNGPPHTRNIMEGNALEPLPVAPKLGKQIWILPLSEIERDTDGDGWTDIEEQRLGLDPSNPDTNGNGIPDGIDVCPNLPIAPSTDHDEENQMIQRAFFAIFGLSGSRELLLVGPDSKPVQLWGYRGPVIYIASPKKWRREHQYGAIFVSWRVTGRLGRQATISIDDYEGPLAAHGFDVVERKIGNEWFVVVARMTWIS